MFEGTLSVLAAATSREAPASCIERRREVTCSKKKDSAFLRLATRLPKNWHSKACSAAARVARDDRKASHSFATSSPESSSSAEAPRCLMPTLATAEYLRAE